MEGEMCQSANHRSWVLLISVVGEILISIIKSVSAIANTASQKASNLAMGFDSDIFFSCLYYIGCGVKLNEYLCLTNVCH